jgi:hypothetical protein
MHDANKDWRPVGTCMIRVEPSVRVQMKDTEFPLTSAIKLECALPSLHQVC